ncbi:MAG: hypothetical protein HY070_13720 [Chloroflexi bacterium]|nr:hypothetical protein [Chloroflexota bacterium]
MRVPRVDRYFILILFFSLFALAPLSAPGYFSAAHDARHSVYFLQMFDQSMRDGAWFPRWAADMVFGYGYPLWLILAPLPFFLGEAFHFVGLDFVSAVKLVDGVAIFFSALAMFGFAARVFTPNKNAALVAAIAYVYIPYHLVDLYVRAAQAELLSFVFPPLILWALYLLAEKQSARHVAYVGFAYAGLLLSHISMAMLFTPLIGMYILFLFLQQKIENHESKNFSALRFALVTFLGLALAFGIAAIFLLPVLAEQRYLTSEPLIGGFFSYRKHFLNASQLVSPFWGYGYAGENGADQFSLQLGLLPLFLAFIAIGRARALTLQLKRHIFFFVAILAFTIFAMLPISANLWDSFAGVIAFAQFPWRGLILAAVALAFLAGAAIATFAESARGNARGILVCLLIVTANFSYTLPQHSEAVFNYAAQMEFEVKDRELLGDTIWTQTRPQDSPLVAQYLAGAPLQKAIAPDDGAMVETTRHAGQSDELRVIANQPARIIVLTRYFPGWTATLDGAPLLIEPYGEQGLIFFRVSAGAHRVHLRFDDTPPRQLGVLISLASILLALGLIAKNSAR